jgi:hypothetical protein
LFAKKTRPTKTHIFFWAGPPSNWYKEQTYSGARALDLTIDRLDRIDIKDPDESALSSRLLATHTFNCSEQWLIAMKGWLFERDIKLSEDIVSGEEFEMLSTQVFAPQSPPKDQPLRREFYQSTPCSVLRTKSPIERKSFDRKCRNFDPAFWGQRIHSCGCCVFYCLC